MNAEAAGKTMPSEEREFVSALSSLCGLTLEDVHKISAEMGAHDLSFAEAALKLGLATPEEIQHAATSGKGGPMVANPSGLVELVVRKLSASRALVVSHGTEVKPGRRLTLTREPYSAHSEHGNAQTVKHGLKTAAMIENRRAYAALMEAAREAIRDAH